MTSKALIPSYISDTSSRAKNEVLFFVSGLAILSLLAQISIHLPWTPVPITGQTLGVSLIALSWGSKRSTTIFASYLVLGALGAPIFAGGHAGLSFGPTFGYLVGMLFASCAMGYLADNGYTKTFAKTFLTSVLGSLIIFSCGLIVLSRFLPSDKLLVAGLYPFLIGDFIKTSISATLSYRARKLQK